MLSLQRHSPWPLQSPTIMRAQPTAYLQPVPDKWLRSDNTHSAKAVTIKHACRYAPRESMQHSLCKWTDCL